MDGKDVRAILPELRRQAGLNRADLARASGVSDGQLSRLESGERGLSVPVAKKLAPALGLTPKELYVLVGFEAVEADALAVPNAVKARLRLPRLLTEIGLQDGEVHEILRLVDYFIEAATARGR